MTGNETVANEIAAQGSTTQTPTESTPPVETAPKADITPASTGETTPKTEGTTTPPVEEWKPDFKLKVMDKEFEWNEHLKKIATKDNFGELKELHEKAYGLPFVKERLEAQKEENKRLKEIEGKYTKNEELITGLSTMLDKKDFFNFFNQLGVTDQDVIQYALQRAKYHEMAPEEKQIYDEKIQSSQRLYELEKQNQLLAQQFQAQQVNARQSELNVYLQREDVRPVAEAFDARVGQPGAFMNEVIRRGQLAYFQKGVDLPVQDAVQEVLTYFGGVPQQTMQTAPTQAPALQQVAPTSKPVIPNVKGGAQSPAKKVIKSIADLRAMAKEL